ncbi:hypothetical protein MMC08_006408 [Hypocenomyce scalaris]|nr:hypothetical protein [Hypocenomyce scalaris]
MAPPTPEQRPNRLEEDQIEVIWEALVPIFRSAWNTVMPMYPISKPSSMSPPQTTAPLSGPGIQSSRRAACTHITMTRLYGDHKCLNCHRTSEFGWVYRCSQDYGGELPISTDPLETIFDVCMDEEAAAKERDGLEPTRLKPWMERAIEEGHYSEEHISVMKAQKQKVRDTINAAEKAFEEYRRPTEPTSSEPEPSNTSTSPEESTTSPSIDASPHLPFPVIEVQNTPPVQQALPAPVDLPDLMPTLPSMPGIQVKLRMQPKCRYKCCQRCRPTFQDRSFQYFEDILYRTVPVPSIDFTADNRPIANAALVRKLGLHKPRPKTIRTFADLKDYRAKEEQDPGYGVPIHRMDYTPDVYGKENEEIEPASKGFRESVRRAFRGMITSSHYQSKSSQSSRMSKRQSRIQEEDTEEFDMGLWNQLNDELLQEASEMKLPGHDGMDGLGCEEGGVEVLDGVSVTEEGVDLGTADIIMSL